MAASLLKIPSLWNNAREEHKQGEQKNKNTFAAALRIRRAKKPSIWCNVCGWVHFKCSGLSSAADYSKSSGKLMCSKCSKTRRLVPANGDSIAYSKLHTLYMSCQSPSSFGSRASLKKFSNGSNEQVDNYLHKN